MRSAIIPLADRETELMFQREMAQDATADREAAHRRELLIADAS